jgi:uncharacterized ion transporter superfamily protein YfcC
LYKKLIMKIGPFEIVIIIVVLLVGLLIVRMAGAARNIRNDSKASSIQNQGKNSRKASTRPTRQYVGLAGIGLIIIGIFLLLSGMSLFKWVMWSYGWFFILVAAGFVVIFMSRRK